MNICCIVCLVVIYKNYEDFFCLFIDVCVEGNKNNSWFVCLWVL